MRDVQISNARFATLTHDFRLRKPRADLLYCKFARRHTHHLLTTVGSLICSSWSNIARPSSITHRLRWTCCSTLSLARRTITTPRRMRGQRSLILNSIWVDYSKLVGQLSVIPRCLRGRADDGRVRRSSSDLLMMAKYRQGRRRSQKPSPLI